MQQPVSRKAAQVAYEAIKEAILRLDLPPDMKVSELELSAMFGVGRTPIREALVSLTSEGFVEAIPRSGYRVTVLTLGDLQELFQLRLLLEVEAAGLACERGLDPALLEHLRTLSAASYPVQGEDRWTEWLRADTAFHTGIAAASGNSRLARYVENLRTELERTFRVSWSVNPAERGQHETLLQAIVSGDPEHARSVAREQVRSMDQSVLMALMASPALLTARISL